MRLNDPIKTKLDFHTSLYVSDVKAIAQIFSINCFLSIPQFVEREGNILRQCPNMKELVNIGSGKSRGIFKTNDDRSKYLITIKGSRLKVITGIRDNNILVTDIGEIKGEGYVDMAYNGTVIVLIVPNTTGYFIEFTGPDTVTLTEISDGEFDKYKTAIRSCTFKDGRFVYATGSQIFIGSLSTDNSGKNFPELSFASAEVKADANIKLINYLNLLYIFGEASIEIFDTATPIAEIPDNFPFSRTGRGSLNYGIVGLNNVILGGESFYFIGWDYNDKNFSLYKGTENSITRISTDGVDSLFSELTEIEISEVSAFQYSENGIHFIGWGFPAFAIVYDATNSDVANNIWFHIRTGESDITPDIFSPYPPLLIRYFEGLIVAMPHNSENLLSISSTIEENYYAQLVHHMSRWYTPKVPQYEVTVKSIEFSTDTEIPEIDGGFKIILRGLPVDAVHESVTLKYTNFSYVYRAGIKCVRQSQVGFYYQSKKRHTVFSGYISYE